RRAHDLLRAARGAADKRPDPGHAGGAADDRARSRGGLGRGDPLRRDRPERSGHGGGRAVSTTLVPQSEQPPASAGTGARRLTERAFRIRESGILVVLVVFVLVTWSVQHRFLNSTNIQFILVN